MSLIHSVFFLLPFPVAVLVSLARSVVDVTLVAPALGCAAAWSTATSAPGAQLRAAAALPAAVLSACALHVRPGCC
jgi:hypothetical protein